MEYNELYHHGVKGMKWGVRRFQKKDGSLTPAGKKRYDDDTPEDAAAKAARSERNKKIAKRVAVAAIMTATVATAAALYAKNPKAVNDFVANAGKKTVEGLKNGKAKAIEAGKKYVKQAAEAGKIAGKEAAAGAKEGFKEGLRNGPKKAVEAVMVGAALMGTKRLLDSTVGKEEAARVFQANNKKKIGSFWKVNDPQDKDDDDD